MHVGHIIISLLKFKPGTIEGLKLLLGPNIMRLLICGLWPA